MDASTSCLDNCEEDKLYLFKKKERKIIYNIYKKEKE